MAPSIFYYRSRMLAVVCVLLGGENFSYAQPDSDNALLAEVRAANRASLAALTTMSVQVKCTVEAGTNVTLYRAAYHRSPVASRISEKNERGDIIRDVLYRQDGTQKAIIGVRELATGNRYLSAILAKDSEIISDMDAWSYALCYIPHERSTLDEMFGRQVTYERTRRVKEGGKNKVHTEFSTPKHISYQVVTDPALNHMIVRIDTQSVRRDGDRKTEVRREYVVESSNEIAPGIFFPTHVVSRGFIDGGLIATHRVELTGAVLNPKHSPGTFELVFPRGVYVEDKIRGTLYQVDGDEKPIGKEMKYSPVASSGSPDEAQGPTPQDADEEPRWSLSKWFLVGFSTMIVVCFFLAIRNRRRSWNVPSAR